LNKKMQKPFMQNRYKVNTKLERLLIAAAKLDQSHFGALDQALSPVEYSDVDEFIKHVVFHRVVPNVISNLNHTSYKTLRNIQLARVITSRLEPVLHRIQSRMQLNRDSLHKALHSINGICIVGLKGIAVERHYGQSPRQSNDIDILVSRENIFLLLSKLVENGYSIVKIRFVLPELYKDKIGYPTSYGICQTIISTPTESASLDIHFGGFPACGEGVIVFGEDDVELNDVLSYPTREANILISMAHIIRQGFCRMRDINDLYRLLGSGELNTAGLAERLKQEHLSAIFESMLKLVRWCYPGLDIPMQSVTVEKPSYIDRLLLLENKPSIAAFTDGVAVKISRIWQIKYLRDLYQENTTYQKAMPRLIKNSLSLFKSGRPYRIWNSSNLPNIEKSQRIVLKPLIWFENPLSDFCITSFVSKINGTCVKHIELDAIIVQFRENEQVVITPSFVLCQCAYNGECLVSIHKGELLKSLIKFVGTQFGIKCRLLVELTSSVKIGTWNQN